ncbi:MAG: hypothetical protein Q4B09_06350 [Lachnospiraceae bacterium]|nr:hypothetical protein [Lachnospiraceae bacterium]
MQIWQILLTILIILIIALIGMYFWGKRLQKKQEAQQEQIEAAKQQVTLLVIDKKRMRITESGLPDMVISQVPRLMRRNKLPIVKVKIGPRVMVMIADEKIYDIIPVGKEVKAVISGLYILEVRALRGKLEAPPKKRTLRDRLLRRNEKANQELKSIEKEEAARKAEKAAKKAARKAANK